MSLDQAAKLRQNVGYAIIKEKMKAIKYSGVHVVEMNVDRDKNTIVYWRPGEVKELTEDEARLAIEIAALMKSQDFKVIEEASRSRVAVAQEVKK